MLLTLFCAILLTTTDMWVCDMPCLWACDACVQVRVPSLAPVAPTCPHLPRAPCVSVEGGTRGDSGFMVSWGARASHSHSHLARGPVGRARVQGHVEPPESIATDHLARNSYDGPPKSAWRTLIRVT